MRLKKSFLPIVAICIGTLLLGSCSLERLFPGRVADGVARLSVNNFAKLILAVTGMPSSDSRPECNLMERFSGVPEVFAEDNGLGRATYRFANCTYDFGDQGAVIDSPSSCGNQKTVFFGKVTLSGSRTYSGILTGDANLPVLPSGPGGLEFSFSRVVFDNYRVEAETQKYTMTNNSGSAAFDIKVHLGKHNPDNHCSIPLPNPELSRIRYLNDNDKPALVTIPGISGPFQVEVNASDFQAQVSIGISSKQDDKESRNYLTGTLTVWGEKFRVPSDKTSRLDPTLTQDEASAAFSESLRCIDNLDQNAQGECRFDTFLADNSARLSILSAGSLLAALAKNGFKSKDSRQECDLSSFEENRFSRITPDQDSRATGKITWNFQKCTYDFGENGTQIWLRENVPTTLFGTVTITGKRIINGHLTRNKNLPVIPDDRKIVFLFDDVTFDNFRVTTPEFNYALTINSKNSSIGATIHLEMNKETKLHTNPLENITFDKFAFSENTSLIISTLEGEFAGDIRLASVASLFEAQVGEYRTTKNMISGSFTVFGNKIQIPTDGRGLIPKDDQLPGKPTAGSMESDSLTPFKAIMVARLLIRNLGTILSQANSESLKTSMWPGCGFASTYVRALPSRVEGENGKKGKIEYAIKDCWVIPENTDGLIPHPCQPNVSTAVKGGAMVRGTQIIVGERSTYLTRPIAIPRHPDAVSFSLSRITPSNFSSFPKYRRDAPDFQGRLQLNSGSFSANVSPVLTSSRDEPCLFDKATPVSGFEIFNVNEIKGVLSLNFKNSPFLGNQKVTINSAHLKAFNGFYQGQGNYLDGSITINGDVFNFDKAYDVLVPEYKQENLDQEYSCRLGNSRDPFLQIIQPDDWNPTLGCPEILD